MLLILSKTNKIITNSDNNINNYFTHIKPKKNHYIIIQQQSDLSSF